MQESDVQEIVTRIIQQAQENVPIEFHQINTWQEYVFYTEQRQSLRAVLKVLRVCANFVFKSYCQDVVEGTADFNALLAHTQFLEITEYYKRELKVITDMIDGYEKYIITGGIFKLLLGIPRGD